MLYTCACRCCSIGAWNGGIYKPSEDEAELVKWHTLETLHASLQSTSVSLNVWNVTKCVVSACLFNAINCY